MCERRKLTGRQQVVKTRLKGNLDGMWPACGNSSRFYIAEALSGNVYVFDVVR